MSVFKSSPINVPTSSESTPRCKRTALDVNSFGLTARIEHIGLCFAILLAVNPV
eukprot:CAMPEP_0202980746 /NCGR_PEP_ID=MMETSP1396-20130829/86609_1 /ASSEMBLY_ACC=CAM_ASM_000872 /TAXON_ID= /ORGANISM="Pseudokeronopsis sp., Strain Brazil" /LENGTH=53 /DNA_ID=CAMNT_0049720903 /DNA_START=62 /DNA_END=223 /DNA_ORIENTATION=+